MVWLSLAFLGLMTLALPHSFVSPVAEGSPEVIAGGLTPLERATLLSHSAAVGLVVLAVPFWIEMVLRLVWIERGPIPTCGVPRPSRRRVFQLIACALVPPLRPGLAPATMPGRAWLPVFGWRIASRPLSRQVQKGFGIPMLCIGLLILPVLAAELLLGEVVRGNHGLALGLDIATRLIWFAFTLEFAIMLAVEPRKIEYAIRHWVDLVIILLPFAAFLRSLQAVRAAQLLKAQRMTQLATTYRLRGLVVKLLQAVLLLRVLETLSDGMARRRIDKVRTNIQRRREEIDELSVELIDLRRTLSQKLRRKRDAKRPPPKS